MNTAYALVMIVAETVTILGGFPSQETCQHAAAFLQPDQQLIQREDFYNDTEEPTNEPVFYMDAYCVPLQTETEAAFPAVVLQ